jgi:hypothetical protein
MAILEEYKNPKMEQEKQRRRSRRLPKTYTVKRGDSWAKIAENLYGDLYPKDESGRVLAQRHMQDLARANSEVSGLRTGMRIRVARFNRNPYVSKGFGEEGQTAPAQQAVATQPVIPSQQSYSPIGLAQVANSGYNDVKGQALNYLRGDVALPASVSNVRGRAALNQRNMTPGFQTPLPPTPGGSLFGPPSPDQLNVPMGALTNLPRTRGDNQFNQAQSQMANASDNLTAPAAYNDIRGQALNIAQGDTYTPSRPPGFQMREQLATTPTALEPPTGISLAESYLSRGIFPPIINAGDPVLSRLTPEELVAAGYVKGDYGQWIRMDYGPGEKVSTGGGSGGGGGGYGRRSYGGTTYPAFGRSPSMTGRDLYTVSLGLINWRI